MSERSDYNLSIELSESSAGWKLTIFTTTPTARRELSALDGAIAEVTVSPNLVPGVPFPAELSVSTSTRAATPRNGGR
jgi:hypothetical protein